MPCAPTPRPALGFTPSDQRGGSRRRPLRRLPRRRRALELGRRPPTRTQWASRKARTPRALASRYRPTPSPSRTPVFGRGRPHAGRPPCPASPARRPVMRPVIAWAGRGATRRECLPGIDRYEVYRVATLIGETSALIVPGRRRQPRRRYLSPCARLDRAGTGPAPALRRRRRSTARRRRRRRGSGRAVATPDVARGFRVDVQEAATTSRASSGCEDARDGSLVGQRAADFADTEALCSRARTATSCGAIDAAGNLRRRRRP